MPTEVPQKPEIKGPITVDQGAAALQALFTVPAKPAVPDPEPTGDQPEVEPEPELEQEPAPEPEVEPEPGVTDEESTDALEQEPELEPEPTYEVKVSGKPVKVTLNELKAGYSRTKDYTQKTQEAAEIRKTAEAKLHEATAHQERYVALLKHAEAQLDAANQEPDWEQARTTLSQADYLALRDDWREYQDKRAKLAEETKAEEASLAEKRVQSYHSFVAEQRQKYPEVIPAWRDPEVQKAESTRMVQFITDLGYGQMIPQIVDARLVAIIRDAMLFREGKAKPTNSSGAKPTPAGADKIAQARARAAAPGAPRLRASDADKRKARAFARVKETGSVSDAADALNVLFKAPRQKR